MKSLVLVLVGAIILGADPAPAGSLPPSAPTSSSLALRGASWSEKPEWKKHFDAAGVRGTFLLFDPSANRVSVYDRKRAQTPFLPASTYKILNSLIGLETGAVRDENEVIRWDGVKRMAEWNKDHTMRTAIAASVVPFYQEIARRVGPERMQHYVDLVGYGNRDLSGGIDHFWLNGGLRITPEEEVGLLVRLQQNQLPFSTRTLEIVKDIMIREKGEHYVLRGKTGWAVDSKPQIGWFVGWIEHDGKPSFFAINIDIEQEKDAEVRIPITKAILREEGLM